jgi:YHS domain-containing protein
MRFILYVVVGVIILSLLRSVLDAIGKAFANVTSAQSSQSGPSPGAPRGHAPETLKKDPVCGTFVSAATSVQKTKGGETYYFCSAACRDKFLA